MRYLSKAKIFLLLAVLLAGTGLWWHSASAAGIGQVYISPASTSVQNGNTVTVALRITPGEAVNGVQATVNFDASKLTYVSIDSSASPFSVQLQQTVGTSSIVVNRGDFGGGVSTDSLVASIVFRAKVGTGSTSLTVTGANATPVSSPGTFSNPSAAGATISFTTPATPPPPAPTPTPTPPSPGGGSSGGSAKPPSSGSTTNTNTGSTTPSSTKTTTAGTTTTPPAGSDAPTVSQTAAVVQYTHAVLDLATNKPTQVYIEYGTDSNLAMSTSLSVLATTHEVELDPSMLIPGTTYYYRVVAKDQAGNITKSAIQTLQTKGYTLNVTVTDRNHQPLKNTAVTLHSTPVSGKTDGSGVATFKNVQPGNHHVEYSSGKKVYSQAVTVLNDVTTTGTTQTAAAQNVAMVLDIAAQPSPIAPVVTILVAAVLAGAIILERRRLAVLFGSLATARHSDGQGGPSVDTLYSADPSVPLPGTAIAPQVPDQTPPPTAPTPTPPPAPSTSIPVKTVAPTLNDQLSQIPADQPPTPGSVVESKPNDPKA